MTKKLFFIPIFVMLTVILAVACSSSSPKPTSPLPKPSTNPAPLPLPTPSTTTQPTSPTPIPSQKSLASSPAIFQIDKLSIEPGRIPAGDRVTITALVSNIGGGQGAYNAELKIDGIVEPAKQITLESGESKTLTFYVFRDIPGTYDVALGDRAAQFVVTQPSQAPVTAAAPEVTPPADNPGGIGKKAPDFTLQTVDGEKVMLAEFKGRPVFLNFWASWCGPCREEIPYLQQLFLENLDKDVVILTVNAGEDRATVKSFLAQNRLTFPVLVVYPDNEVQRSYDVRFIPTTFLIDKNGMIKAQRIGSFRDKTEMASFMRQ